MPKIIDNPEARLIEEAQRQIEQGGYSALTIRSVAGACGMGVGTVYNYFPSKEALVARFLLKDWAQCVDAITQTAARETAPRPVLRCMYDQLNAFSDRHQAIFRDEAAAVSFSGSFSRYHVLLRGQLAAPLEPFCRDAFAAEFIAEALLTWTVAGIDFDVLCGKLELLL